MFLNATPTSAPDLKVQKKGIWISIFVYFSCLPSLCPLEVPFRLDPGPCVDDSFSVIFSASGSTEFPNVKVGGRIEAQVTIDIHSAWVQCFSIGSSRGANRLSIQARLPGSILRPLTVGRTSPPMV